MSDEKHAGDSLPGGNAGPSGEARPYRTPHEVGGDDKPAALVTKKRLWLALLVVVLIGGGAFAALSTAAIMMFGGMNRGGPPIELQNTVQNFGEEDRVPPYGGPDDDPFIEGSAQEEVAP